jgi:hypothetical protein
VEIADAIRRLAVERTHSRFRAIDGPAGDRFDHAKLVEALEMSMEALMLSEWFPADSAPQDGTPFLACGGGTWDETYHGIAPATCRFRTYHPNQPGKTVFRWEDGRPAEFRWWRKMPTNPNVKVA